MTDESAKEAWSEVGEKFSSWGRRVAASYHATAQTDAAAADEAGRELTTAAKELVEELSRGFSALGHTLRNDEANRDLGAALNAIGDAITATVQEATDGVRSGKSEQAPPDDPPPG